MLKIITKVFLTIIIIVNLQFLLVSTKAQASGILPPNNPPNNIAPNPNFFNVCTRSYSIDNSQSCEFSALLAIDNARANEGVAPIDMPANFLSMSPSQQLFAITNLERVGRGLSPITGTTTTLDNLAQAGAQNNTDPILPSNYTPTPTSWGSIWAGGYASVMEADYEWMYYDGYGSTNINCSSPSAPGCWGHRDIILSNYDCNPCAQGGAGYVSSSDPYSPSYASIFVGSNSGASYSYSFTWNQVKANLVPTPSITSVSPNTIPENQSQQIVIYGTNLSNTLEVRVGTTIITSINQVSSGEITFSVPPLGLGSYNVEVITPGGGANSTLSVSAVPVAPAISGYAGNSDADLFWNEPNNVGAPISAYIVSLYDSLGNLLNTFSDNTSSSLNTFVVGNLNNGTSYQFSVQAINKYGVSPQSNIIKLTPNSNLTPSIITVTPSSGLVNLTNQDVEIYGAAFYPVSSVSVFFGSSEATVISGNDTQLQVQVPVSSQSGAVNVYVQNNSMQSNSVSFNYLPKDGYVPIPPQRIFDTRANSGYQGSGQTLSSGGSDSMSIPNLPTNVNAVVLNITVTDTAASSYLTVTPLGLTNSVATSNINWSQGETIATLSTVAINGGSGKLLLTNANGSADVIVDLEGYYVPSGLTSLYQPWKQNGTYSPQRIVDTRCYPNNPALYSQDDCHMLGPNQSLTFSAIDNGASASALILNVTVTNTTANGGYLTLYPSGTARPIASNINWYAGETVANRVIVQGSSITVYNALGYVNVIIDAVGFFNQLNGSYFVPLAPFRYCDTRSPLTYSNPCEGKTLNANSTLSVSASNLASIVSFNVSGVVGTVTATNTTSWSYLVLYPNGSVPVVSNLNWSTAGTTIANAFMEYLSSNSDSLNIYNSSGSSDVIIDIDGVFY